MICLFFPTFAWRSYIKTREECARAISTLQGMPNGQQQGVTAQLLADHCPDRFDDPGNTRPAFAQCQKTVSKAACEQTNGTFKFPGTTLICRRSCDEHMPLCTRSTPGASDAPPLGYCVLEHDQADLSTQKAAFYTDTGGGHPGRYYQGKNFTAVCKIKECSTYEEVKGDGARVVGPRAATEDDDAQCIPNPEQLATWERAEGTLYRIFYTVLSVFSAVYWTAAVWWLWHTRTFDWKAGDNNWTADEPAPSSLLWQLFRVKLFMLAREWMRLMGMASSWGFYGISITALRFEYLARDQGYDPDQIALGALVASTFATLLLVPDIRLVRWQWNVCKVNMLTSANRALAGAQDQATLKRPTPVASGCRCTRKATKYSTGPTKKYSKSLPTGWDGNDIGALSWWHTVAVVVCEDTPQLTLTALYYRIVGFDAGDEIAMGSLILSILGFLINLAIILPLYRNRDRIYEYCGKLVAKSSAPKSHVSLVDAVATKKSENTQRTNAIASHASTWNNRDADRDAAVRMSIAAKPGILDPDGLDELFGQEDVNAFHKQYLVAETTLGYLDVAPVDNSDPIEWGNTSLPLPPGTTYMGVATPNDDDADGDPPQLQSSFAESFDDPGEPPRDYDSELPSSVHTHDPADKLGGFAPHATEPSSYAREQPSGADALDGLQVQSADVAEDAAHPTDELGGFAPHVADELSTTKGANATGYPNQSEELATRPNKWPPFVDTYAAGLNHVETNDTAEGFSTFSI